MENTTSGYKYSKSLLKHLFWYSGAKFWTSPLYNYLLCIKSVLKDKHFFGTCMQNSKLFNNVTADMILNESDKSHRCVVSCFYEVISTLLMF
jgi:hypothetical protein